MTRRAQLLILAGLVGATVALSSAVWHRYRQPGRIVVASATSPREGQPAEGETGLPRESTEIVVTFIGASWCAGLSDTRLPGAVKAISEAVGQGARADMRLRVRRIAVWMSDKPEHPQILDKYGPFDELVSGGRWLNTGTIRYLWADVPGEPTLRQVIISRRLVTTLPAGMTVGREELLARFVGAFEIVHWSRSSRIRALGLRR